MKELRSLNKSVWLAVTVAALGYFVDIYDLLLFSIVRVNSLKDLGVAESDLLEAGVQLINVQMAGLLIGGVLWGILGDKRGRLSVLFGSIFLYSIANIANGFVQNVEQYAILRFIAGVGLAGELGAGITLISEILPKHIRGYGTSIVAAIGILGAVFGGLTGDIFNWRVAYFIGGGMGFLILLLRVGVRESSMFHKIKESSTVTKGNFFSIFRRKETFLKYLYVVLIGVPVWFVVGILVTFAPEFGVAMGMTEIPTAGKAVMFSYTGLAIGDLLSGILCQWAKSRRKVIAWYLVAVVTLVALHFVYAKYSLNAFYISCLLMGIAVGYWAMFVTVAAEQFGTNIRSTVTTSVPNFVRASVIPLTTLFKYLNPSVGLVASALIVGGITLTISFGALYMMQETFHKDLDYLE
jgi:MFS transporter, putative metabolite:H+ symporter